MSFQSDIEIWADVLRNMNVDKTAMQELFLLAQHSNSGYQEANSIVGKLLKKAADQEELAKPSAFVHRCVTNARSAIGSWTWEVHGKCAGSSGSASSTSKGWTRRG